MGRLAVAVLIAAAPVTAHAELSDHTMQFFEAIIPDARLEYSLTDSSDRYVLSLPVAWHTGLVRLGPETALGFVTVAEGQWQMSTDEWRGLVGERVLLDLLDRLKGFAPLVEVSGVLGTDGHGLVLGTGLAWGYGAYGATLGIVGRYVITNEERRMDVALDLMLPLNVLDELGGWQ